MLRREAAHMKYAHEYGGRWESKSHMADHDEMLALARGLERLAKERKA